LIRGVIGVVIATSAILWPDWTVFAAVELIGAWAIMIGVLELVFVRHSGENARQHAPLIIAGVASIAIGIGVMKKVFLGAALVGVLVGIAAAARGISLIVLGVSRRRHQESGSEKQAVRSAA